MELQASKVSGSQLSCKLEGDAPWKGLKSTKLHPIGAQCPYGVSPMDLSKVEILQALLYQLALHVQIRIKCVEDEKIQLFEKLIGLRFNMEDQKMDVLEMQCNFIVMEVEC